MYNKKVIIDAIKNLNKAKTFPKYNNAYTNNKPNKKNSNNITSEQGVNTPVFKSVHAAPSKIHGKGLFTQEPISKGDTIGVSHIRKKFMKNNEEYQAPFPSKQLGYYNHSESPNVYEVDNGDHIIMKAKRNINPGEELTANYYNANIKDLENPDNFKKGGATNRPKLPNKKNSKAYSRSFEATNRLFAQNPLFSKPKSRKNKIFDPNAKYYANGGENSCEPFYKWDSTLNKCVPFTEEEKANYSLQYMRDWTSSPMHKEMLTTSVGKDAPLGDVNKYVDNITNLRLKALNSNLRIEDVDPKQKGVLGEAAPLGSDPYVNNVPVIIRNGNKQTINPKVSTEDDIKNYNTFRSPLYYSQLNNAKFKDPTLENFTKDFKGDATFYTRNRPGEHAYVYPHEFSHLSDFGGELIPISDRKLIKEWQSHYPDYPAAYDKYIFKDVKSLTDQYKNKIITKDEYDKRTKDLETEWYLNNKDKRYYSDKEMYENNFNKFKKQGDYSDDTLTNDLPYDDFIRKNKINFDAVDYKRYVGTNSEVRARVNAIRMYGKAAGIYDPFTEKLTPEKYKELNKLFENQNLNEKDVNQLRQLKHLYNDDEILNLINTLSKNDSEIENDIQYGKKGGALPKAQYGLTGLGKDRGVTASPFDFRTPYGQSNDFFKNPNYSLTYTTPNLFKKIDMAANPLSFTIGRPYYTDAQRLTHPSLDTDAIYTQDYFGSSWQGQFGPEYEQYLQDVSDYSGVPVSGLNQTILNKYNAAQNLAAVKPTYKKGIPLTANVEYSLLGSAFGDKSTGPFSGALTFGAGYAPEPGFYGSVDASAYGVFGKRKNNQKIRPNHYFNKGLTRQGDRVWIPRLNIFNTVLRQRPEYNDAQTQKILELYKEDIERGTTTAEDFMADNEDQSSYNRYNISALSPELTFQVKPFKKIPGILSLTAGLRNTLGGKDKSETTVGGQWTSRPYGNIRYSVPVEGAIDRLKDLDLPPIKKRKSYYDYVNENEQTDDNNEPPTDNTFPPEDTSTDENTMQPSYDGEGVGKGPCPRGYERLCEKCRCTKIKTRRSPLLDKRGMHPYIDGKYLEDGGITVDLTPEEIEEYAKGGYIIEDISVPTLTRMQDGGLPKAFEGRPVKIKEKEKEKESEKINAVNTNIENLGTDYRPNVTSEKTSFNLGNFIKPLYDISKIKTDISKALAKSSTTQFLNATRPMEMALIKDLKNQGLISETLPEEILTTYPNLLDLATRRGIQKANTVFRGTRPFIGNSNILRSSENTQTELPLEYSNYLKSLPSDVARAAYMSSHISPINVGARVGLDHVIGMTTPMDALYYSRQNVDNPSMEYTYGPLQTELRFPFDFSEGNASTWLQKYREMPFRWKKQEDGSIEKNREYAPGVIHNIDIFTGSEHGNEGAILGLRNQRVLEPVRVRYNETFKNLEDEESLHNYFYDIMSKKSPEEQSDYITHFNNEILPQLDLPKDYLKDRGFTNFGPAESLYDVHSYLWHHNRYLKDLAKKPSNIQVIPYSPFSFKFKEGGQFELGDEVELTKEQLKKLQEEGYTFEIVK